MTIAYLHLIRLHPSTVSPQAFLTLIHQHGLSYHYTPLTTSVARHWVVRPSITHASVLNQPWDVLVLLQPPSDDPTHLALAQIPTSLSWAIADRYTLKIAVPSKLLKDFAARNEGIRAQKMPEFDMRRLEEISNSVNMENKGHLEANPELLEFAKGLMAERRGVNGALVDGSGPVTMLNFLRFNDGEPGRESYKRYGKEFADSVGSKRGGNAKIVGRVLGHEGSISGSGQWDEVAVVHYPNIVAFSDMASGKDYQEANATYRLPALKDTLLLCTTELAVGSETPTAKL